MHSYLSLSVYGVPVLCRRCVTLQTYTHRDLALELITKHRLSVISSLKSNQLRVERACREMGNENIVLGHEEQFCCGISRHIEQKGQEIAVEMLQHGLRPEVCGGVLCFLFQ